jgi:hypothetical protein
VLVEWFETGRLALEDEERTITDVSVARAMLGDRVEKCAGHPDAERSAGAIADVVSPDGEATH